MSTVGGVQYHGGYHLLLVEYRGDIMIHVGRYHEYCGGCSVPQRHSKNKRFIPHSIEHPPQYS